jgi:hypothetical protein
MEATYQGPKIWPLAERGLSPQVANGLKAGGEGGATDTAMIGSRNYGRWE